ncbi:MAG TPA: helix-turn-helix domain-containing protein [Pseudomonadota bacterium]|nr:helix-turn-helix domain-containing protein [Pseudomonadota bacterium]
MSSENPARPRRRRAAAPPAQAPNVVPAPDAAPPPAPRRRRRAPAEAQALILDAAERLFADRGPDRVSVLDVAVAAGVSHSLVLHYFKTYAELVRSVLARRNRAVFQQVKDRLARDAATGAAPQPDELLGLVLGVVAEPAHARLLAWAALSGEGQHLKMVQNRGLSRVVDLAAARLSSLDEVGAAVPRDRIEEAILVAIAAVHGYATGKSVYLPALGQSDAAAVDLRFRRALGAMLRAFLSDAGAGTGAAD